MNSKSIAYDSIKHKAKEMRKQGKMYSEITALLGAIPKSTMSYWFKDIELSELQKERILKVVTKNGQRGRYIGAQMNHVKRIQRLNEIRDAAISEFYERSKDKDFIAGLVLYLAEGTKKSEQFQFMNSDPYLIKYMVNWIINNSNIKLSGLRFRLYIHKLYENENCEDFWSKKLGINKSQFLKTVYKNTAREYKKNPDYKGCLRLEVSGSELYWKIIAWRDCFYNTIID